jgi:protocatechuate 3,4-dioxygenase beta subunit
MNRKSAPPQSFYIPLERRKFLKSIGLASAGFLLPGYLAEALTIAPQVTQGPYYPLAANIPLDDDNDLIYLNDSTTAATGLITYLSGRVLDSSGNPIRNALVELWHADNNGNYIYSSSSTRNSSADSNFAGFGQFLTGSSGAYLFRTIKAGLYVGRTRHFHMAVTIPGQTSRYCTQLFWTGTQYSGSTAWSTQNSTDNVYSTLTTAQKAAVTIDYAATGNGDSSVAGTFDFVVGLTPTDPTYPSSGGFLYKGALVSGPSGGNPRFKLTFPIYTGYTYEVYGNPTLADTAWAALPFSLTQTGTIDRNRYTATANGTLSIYVEEKATKDFYKVSFRVPGANTGTP